MARTQVMVNIYIRQYLQQLQNFLVEHRKKLLNKPCASLLLSTMIVNKILDCHTLDYCDSCFVEITHSVLMTCSESYSAAGFDSLNSHSNNLFSCSSIYDAQ